MYVHCVLGFNRSAAVAVMIVEKNFGISRLDASDSNRSVEALGVSRFSRTSPVSNEIIGGTQSRRIRRDIGLRNGRERRICNIEC